MKNVLIAGSSGMIGNLILHKCLSHPEVKHITSVVRRGSGITHSKLTEIVHTDFMDFKGIEDKFKNIDCCFFCIGVYTGTVSREEFRTITVSYIKAFATVLKTESPQASFCFLSGQGADQSEKSAMMFARDKGIAENFLLGLQFAHTYIFRPGYIYPVTPRKEPTFAYRMMRVLYPVLNVVYHSGVISSEELANAMLSIGLHGGDKTVYENPAIRKLQE